MKKFQTPVTNKTPQFVFCSNKETIKMKTKILVLGAGYAGIMAVNRLVKQNENIKITLINESETFVERIRNHERAVGNLKQDKKIQDLIPSSVQFIKAKIKSILPLSKEIEISNSNERISYDYLFYTLGSTKIQNKMNCEYGINTKEESNNLEAIIRKKETGKIWILGGGLTGIELATEIKESYPNWAIGILEKGLFAESFSKKGQDYIRSVFQEMKIEIIENKEFHSFQENKIILKDGNTLECDFFIKSFGLIGSEIGKKAGLKVNNKNQIYVNEYLRVNEFPEIFVAGDSAFLAGSPLRMGCVTAMPMGVYIADTLTMLLKNETPPTFKFKFTGRCVSLGRKKGIIQMVNADDSPIERIIKGKKAAFIKELVCKFTMLAMKSENKIPFRVYNWPKSEIKPNLSKEVFQHV
jgi:NADH:ubiquinone reductase (H+-translocating)